MATMRSLSYVVMIIFSLILCTGTIMQFPEVQVVKHVVTKIKLKIVLKHGIIIIIIIKEAKLLKHVIVVVTKHAVEVITEHAVDVIK